jgi:hypothetical protein
LQATLVSSGGASLAAPSLEVVGEPSIELVPKVLPLARLASASVVD